MMSAPERQLQQIAACLVKSVGSEEACVDEPATYEVMALRDGQSSSHACGRRYGLVRVPTMDLLLRHR